MSLFWMLWDLVFGDAEPDVTPSARLYGRAEPTATLYGRAEAAQTLTGRAEPAATIYGRE